MCMYVFALFDLAVAHSKTHEQFASHLVKKEGNMSTVVKLISFKKREMRRVEKSWVGDTRIGKNICTYITSVSKRQQILLWIIVSFQPF